MITNALEFSIDRWQELVVEKGTHHVETAKGAPARIICTDVDNSIGFTIIALRTDPIVGGEYIGTYTKEGHFNGEGVQDDVMDIVIVPNPPKSLGWVLVYGDGAGYANLKGDLFRTQKGALDNCPSLYQPIACIEVFEGQGITPTDQP